MSWLERLNPNKPTKSSTTSAASFKPPSRPHSPGPPNVPKITPANRDAPKVILSNEDDALSPVSVNLPGTPSTGSLAPSPIINGNTKPRSNSQVSANSSVHRRAATTPAGPNNNENDGATSPSQKFGVSRSNLHGRESETEKDRSGVQRSRKPSNVEVPPNSYGGMQLTDSPPQSIGSRRSGSVSSGENPGVYQPMVVESPTAATHEQAATQKGGATLSAGDVPSKPNGSDAKKGKSWRKPTHSPEGSHSKKPAVRHQTTMGMGLASALAASGMGIMPSNPIMLPPQAAASALAPPGATVRRQSTAVPASKSPGGDEINRRRSEDIRPRAASATSSITPRASAQTQETKSSSNSEGEEDEEDDDDEDFDSTDALSFGDEEIAITGFAVATMKRNQEFHEMFPSIPQDDYLIDDYGCALQREILIQGRLYISENHMCFHASIFGWVTNLIIPFYNVSAIEKKMTAFVIPNAIGVTEENPNGQANKHTFASFLARDTAFDVIYNIWKHSAPNAGMGQPGNPASAVAAVDENGALASPGAGAVGPDGKPRVAGGKVRKATQCACSKNGQHYANVALEAVVQGSPEQIYSLMFQSGFIKDFMVKDQKLTDIQISDWQPSPDKEHLLSRTLSYIKPLSGGFGPKQTKCELRDENQHVDFDDYISTITTTRTPEVPSGNVFSVKTRTCITWAGSSTTKITVTFTIEWTGRSLIKGIIEKSAGDGQKTYYKELEAAMRKYISENRNEFKQEGVDNADADHEAEVEEAALSPTTESPGQAALQTVDRPQTGTARALQWALDTFEGATRVATDSFAGALEIIGDLITSTTSSDGSAKGGGRSTTILTVIIILLVISNIYTITTMGAKEELGKRKALEKRDSERERWIEQAVKAVLSAQQSNSSPTVDTTNTQSATNLILPTTLTPGTTFDTASAKAELKILMEAAEALEQRLAQLNTHLRTRLDELD